MIAAPNDTPHLSPSGPEMNQPDSQTSTSGGASRHGGTLITGANGEFGHGLIRTLYDGGHRDLIALDVREIDAALKPLCRETIVGDITDTALLSRLHANYEIHSIFHLAALLSTRSEFNPEAAHHVNVVGTLHLLKLAVDEATSHGSPVRFMFPSSIAVYGVGNLQAKAQAGAVSEDQCLQPATMYGCNKLACEHLGRYYARHYRQLAKDRPSGDGQVDFRCIRFPGVISAFTLPSGGTSDYAPEMIHAAARSESYACFVREDARIPFITMPDAIEALLKLHAAVASRLTRSVYNITAFAPSAGEIARIVRSHFKAADITFKPDVERQGIVDSWPENTIDAAARNDWGFKPQHDLKAAFEEYLIPNIRAHYAK